MTLIPPVDADCVRRAGVHDAVEMSKGGYSLHAERFRSVAILEQREGHQTRGDASRPMTA